MSGVRRPAAATSGRPAGAPAAGFSPARPVQVSAAMGSLSWLSLVGITAVGAVLVLAVVAPGPAERSALPVAVVGALLGIPHGAVDHLVPWWWGSAPAGGGTRRGRARTACVFAGFVSVYVVIAGLALAALLLAPTPTLLAFFVLSAAHFGRGEVVASAERAGRPTPGPAADWLVAAAFGVGVVGLLLWARPADTDPLLGPLSPWIAEMVVRTRPVAVVTVAVVVVIGLVVLLRARRRLEAAELALVVGTFAVAPPLAAFGVYFGAWHALRHTGRLLDLARGRRRDLGHADAGWAPAGVLLLRSAALPTVAALATVAVLWLARDLASLQAEVGVLLALSFPHAAVVWALDRHEARTA